MATLDEAVTATAQGDEQGSDGVRGDRPGRPHEHPGDPTACCVGTPVSHTTPA